MTKSRASEPQYQETVVDGHEVIYSSDWLKELESEEHFGYYWQQASLAFDNLSHQDKILELGCGTKFLSDLLLRRCFDVSTLDIDPDKHPDYCSDAASFDYSTESFNVLLAFEIFEHIPWVTFGKVLRQVSLSSIDHIIFSVPWAQRVVAPLRITIPRVRAWDLQVRLPTRTITTKAHFWELQSRRTQRKNLDVPFRTLQEVHQAFHESGWSLAEGPRRGPIQFFQARR